MLCNFFKEPMSKHHRILNSKVNVAAIAREAVGNAHGLYVVVVVVNHKTLSVFALNRMSALLEPLPFTLM
jgi:hypothetical protein